jgi:hypothetical protein
MNLNYDILTDILKGNNISKYKNEMLFIILDLKYKIWIIINIILFIVVSLAYINLDLINYAQLSKKLEIENQLKKQEEFKERELERKEKIILKSFTSFEQKNLSSEEVEQFKKYLIYMFNEFNNNFQIKLKPHIEFVSLINDKKSNTYILFANITYYKPLFDILALSLLEGMGGIIENYDNESGNIEVRFIQNDIKIDTSKIKKIETKEQMRKRLQKEKIERRRKSKEGK